MIHTTILSGSLGLVFTIHFGMDLTGVGVMAGEVFMVDTMGSMVDTAA